MMASRSFTTLTNVGTRIETAVWLLTLLRPLICDKTPVKIITIDVVEQASFVHATIKPGTGYMLQLLEQFVLR